MQVAEGDTRQANGGQDGRVRHCTTERARYVLSDRIRCRADQLAHALSIQGSAAVILALLRGGVAGCREVAAALDAPLDLILVRKIGVPMQPELAMGAVANGGVPIVVRNDEVIRMAGVDEAQFEAVAPGTCRNRAPPQALSRQIGRLSSGRACRHRHRRWHRHRRHDPGSASRHARRQAEQARARHAGSRRRDTLVAHAEEADDVICLEDHEFLRRDRIAISGLPAALRSGGQGHCCAVSSPRDQPGGEGLALGEVFFAGGNIQRAKSVCRCTDAFHVDAAACIFDDDGIEGARCTSREWRTPEIKCEAGEKDPCMLRSAVTDKAGRQSCDHSRKNAE